MNCPVCHLPIEQLYIDEDYHEYSVFFRCHKCNKSFIGGFQIEDLEDDD